MARQVKSPHNAELAVLEAARHNPAEFEKLYRNHVQPIFKYLYSHVGNRHDAEDLTAQTFLAAFEGLPGYRNNGHFPAWLFSIARNKAADFYRKRGRLAETELRDTFPAKIDLPGEIYESSRIETISKIIHSLPEPEQELLRLRFVADLSFVEIAALQGRKLDAVKKQLYRLLARVQSQMETENE